MEGRLPRKLAAILYADVAGYSRLTGQDEDATHRRLSEYLDLISATVEDHRGRVMQNAVLREAGGNVYACDHYVYSKYNLGNILNTTIAEMVNSARQRKFGTDKLDTLLSDSDGRIPAYLR